MKLNPSMCLKILLTRNKQSLGAYKDLVFQVRESTLLEFNVCGFYGYQRCFTQKKSCVES